MPLNPLTDIGHNSLGAGTVAAGQLRALVERIERLEQEKQDVVDQIKEVYAEAKATGFCNKTIRKTIQVRRKTAEERQEEEAMLDLYMHALGMLADTPLGKAAAARDLEKAVAGMGTPMPLTEAEKERGHIVAFDRDGTRMSIGILESADASKLTQADLDHLAKLKAKFSAGEP